MAQIEMVYNISVHHMPHFGIFFQLYFINFIKDVFISATNKCLKSPMVLGEYFCVIGCGIIMECYVGHSIRELFSKDLIIPQRGAPIHLNHIISGRRLEKINHAMS